MSGNYEGRTCSGCGIQISDGYSLGCSQCSNRRTLRLRRGLRFTATGYAGEAIDNETGRLVAWHEPEKWRSVARCPAYEVSDQGRVRRIESGKGAVVGRVLKPGLSGNGYRRATLFRDGVMWRPAVHELVLEAFVGPRPSPAHQANHLDGVKDNNAVWNLEWVTQSENMRHAIATGLKRPRFGSENPATKLTEDDVRAIRASDETGVALAIRYGVTKGLIYSIRHRRIWKAVA